MRAMKKQWGGHMGLCGQKAGGDAFFWSIQKKQMYV
jgi:hypothetical protein